MSYERNFFNVLPNGLTLLQNNPDCAAQLNSDRQEYGWLYVRGPDNQWVTRRKLSEAEIEMAKDQASDGMVLQGTKVRAG